MNTSILISIEITRYCEHEIFDPSCIWCIDAIRIKNEIEQRALNKSHFTVVKIKSIEDTQIGE